MNPQTPLGTISERPPSWRPAHASQSTALPELGPRNRGGTRVHTAALSLNSFSTTSKRHLLSRLPRRT